MHEKSLFFRRARNLTLLLLLSQRKEESIIKYTDTMVSSKGNQLILFKWWQIFPRSSLLKMEFPVKDTADQGKINDY